MNGFVEKLRLHNIFNGGLINPPSEPLFGGLIPRRETAPEAVRETIRSKSPSRRERQLSRESNRATSAPSGRPTLEMMRGQQQSIFAPRYGNMNTVYDPSMENVDLNKKQIRFAEERARIEDQQRADNLAHEEKKLRLADQTARERSQIEAAKFQLDKWKEENPTGEIETGADGYLYLINKRTGQSTKTNVKSGDLTEKQKIEMNIAGQKEVETLRQTGREKLETIRQKGRPKPTRYINPSQQRIAEDDAAAELLRSPKYKELMDKGIIVYDQAGNISIGERPKTKYSGGLLGYGEGIDDPEGIRLNKLMDEFDVEWKANANSRLMRAYPGGIEDGPSATEDETDEVEMINPRNGKTILVPRNEVEEARKNGAKLPGEK